MKRIMVDLMIVASVIVSTDVISFLSFAQPPIQTKPIKPPLASILDVRIVECAGGDIYRSTPANMGIVWTYGGGLKPDRVVISVHVEHPIIRGSEEVAGSETRVSMLLFGKPAESPMGTIPQYYMGSLGDKSFTLTFTTNYVLSGSRTYTFTKRCGE